MIYVLFYYIISTIVYILVGDGSMFWACFNMISVMMPMVYVMHKFMSRYRLKGMEFAWMEFACVLTISRCIFTTSVLFAPNEWIYKADKYFSFIFIIWMVIKLIKHRGI